MVVIDGEAFAISLGIYSTNCAFAMLGDKESVIVHSADDFALSVATLIAFIPATIRGTDIARELVKFLHFGAIQALLGFNH